MLYCLNSNCLQPNLDRSLLCSHCGTSLKLQNRYHAVKILSQNSESQTFKVFDNSHYYRLKQLSKQGISRDYLTKLSIDLQQIERYPDIPPLIDSFVLEDRYYLIWDFIEGDNLEILVSQHGTFSLDQVWQLLLDILPVLDCLSNYNLVHRQIEPKFVIYNSKLNKFLLIDWSGIINLKNTSFLLDISPEYSAAECLAGRADFSSDLYSLGLVCLYLLTGMRPFDLFDIVNNNWQWRDYLPDINLESNSRSIDRSDKRKKIYCPQRYIESYGLFITKSST
jgi:serine/threonine protein kinase